jgi:beta-ureidopropionase / N-carbamoyl-L-amino-acid hydrolase
VRFRGRADHAGTTPMTLRRDPAFAMFEFATALAGCFRAVAGADSVWNFGIVSVRPGAANVVPAEADLTVEFRDADARVIEGMETAFHEAVTAANGRSSIVVSSERSAALAPASMDAELTAILAEAAAATGASHVRMPSGAGHDAMILAPRIPAAMLFVPSIDGRSHDISENTSEADLRRGLRVFAAALSKMLDHFAQAVSQGEVPPHRQKEAAK